MEFILQDKVILKGVDNRAAFEIKKELTCSNPEYIKLSKLDKWTGSTPKNLIFYEEKNGQMICPRGFSDRAYRICKKFHDDIKIIDKRAELPELDIKFCGKLKDFQKNAVDSIIKSSHGVLSAGTGSGKTVMALFVIAERKQPTIIVVHTIELLNQWIDRTEKFLNINLSEIGIIGAGKYKIGEKITVGLYQSIRKNVKELNSLFGQVIVDECHKCPSKTFTEAVNIAKKKKRKIKGSA
ncbi:MAG: DEAD/DEAH box helicase family protein [Desulfamplus sp.]|nr:DEAD/DEAH box helicase family protein [Desulfamplus sp.]